MAVSGTAGGGTASVSHPQVTVRAQGKLNLRLRVLARETSGYHSIETILHRIELSDDVHIVLQPPGTRAVRCSVDVGPMPQNLAYRAAVAFCEAARWTTGFDIAITKRIPAGGGLGGGSADAAATLRGLNALAPHPLSPSELLHVAVQLGADVPFLTSDAVMALAWGRGERLLSLDPLPQRTVALMTPPFRVATVDAYGWVDAARAEGDVSCEAEELHYWQLANWGGIAPWAVNDFEPVVMRRFPQGGAILRALRDQGALIAGMTGSGSTLFGIFDPPPDAAALERQTGVPVVLTRTACGVAGVAEVAGLGTCEGGPHNR